LDVPDKQKTTNMQKKNILISGGSSGIGLAIAAILAEEKEYAVISLSRSHEKIERALNKHPALTNQIDFITGDATCEEDCKRLSRYIGDNYGILHGLVNNAGILTKGGMEAISYEHWKFNLDINLNAPYLLTKTLLPLLKAASGASVINISSIASLKPGSSVAYSVSKAGLDMLTEFMAGDLGPYKIRVNSINPGLVRTHIHLDNKIVDDEQAYEALIEKAVARYPIGRVGDPEDIARLALFLLSDDSSFITGTIIKADGGANIYNDLIPPKTSKRE
jgi:NAD(P)-dependent dehydrogenase (short-subunit alcohol dehydrogenase family)